MPASSKFKRLLDAYGFPGFRPQAKVRGIFDDPKARVITMVRGSKKRLPAVPVVWCTPDGTTAARGEFATCPVRIRASIWRSRSVASVVEVAAR